VKVEVGFHLEEVVRKPASIEDKKGALKMRFMMIVQAKENSGPPPQQLMDAIGKIAEEATKAGQMIESGGLAPTAAGSRVRLSGGNITVIDGPFTEAKEVFGGYAVFELKSKKEAIDSAVRFMELHKQYWPGWEGVTEVREQTFVNGRAVGAE
jgi:hypothetical protein